MKFTEILKVALVLSLVATLATLVYGWFANIVHLVMHTPEMGTEFVLRLLGVFVGPLGSAMGLFF